MRVIKPSGQSAHGRAVLLSRPDVIFFRRQIILTTPPARKARRHPSFKRRGFAVFQFAHSFMARRLFLSAEKFFDISRLSEVRPELVINPLETVARNGSHCDFIRESFGLQIRVV